MKHLLLTLLLLVSIPTWGSACPDFYPNEAPLAIPGSGEICKSFFVIIYDQAQARTIMSIERVGSVQLSVERHGRFYNNPVVALDTNHYPVGYDRGHLVPAADADTADQMHETFDLANSAPQNPALNRGKWAQLERSVREGRPGPQWILTGVVYQGSGRVPTWFYKVVYRAGATDAYLVRNDSTSDIQRITVPELRAVAGLNIPD